MTSPKSVFLSTCSVQRDVSNDYVAQAMIANTVNRNRIGGLPDVLFPMEGERSAGNKTINLCLHHSLIRK